MTPPTMYGADIEALKVKVQFLQEGQYETRKLMREHQDEIKEEIQKEIKELKDTIRPLSEAFQRAKGFWGAVIVFATLALLGIGAGMKNIVEWLLSGLKP